MVDVIEIDGSVGEGGGQVLRTALSLAALLIGGHYEWQTDGLWEDEVWCPNWTLDAQRETKHYVTNKMVIDNFKEDLT